MFKKLLALLGLGEHAEFIWGILDWLGLTRPITLFLYGVGGGVSGYLAHMADWPPIGIFLAVIGSGAGLAIVYAVFSHSSAAHKTTSALEGSKTADLEPDISAQEAYFQILDSSQWREEQLRNTTDTKNLVRDWLEVRLSDGIHKALRNSRLASWGEECLHGTAPTPEKPIPPETWDKVVIVFDRNPNLPRTAAYFKGRVSFEHGRMAWVGIKFSRDQIFKIFPLATQKEVAKRLDDLYAEGVGKRNKLIPAIPNFDREREHAIFTEWDSKVLDVLNADCVTISEKSSFRTLNLYQPIAAAFPNKTANQGHLESMWTEKLRRLKLIIDRVGA